MTDAGRRTPGRARRRTARRPVRVYQEDSRTVAPDCGTAVAVITDSCRSPEKVTVSSEGSVCDVRTVNPRTGTADTRHTLVLPNRTDACPPLDWMVCTPAPSAQLGSGVTPPLGSPLGECEGDGDTEGVALFVTDGRGEALLVVGEGLGFRLRLRSPPSADGSANTVGAEWAIGGVGRVEPTTNRTVSTTAVTLTAVHENQMIR